jgi:hypothetical protein
LSRPTRRAKEQQCERPQPSRKYQHDSLLLSSWPVVPIISGKVGRQLGAPAPAWRLEGYTSFAMQSAVRGYEKSRLDPVRRRPRGNY